MSKDKKNEGKEILEEFKELSEWQKRNQEYLKKKAEEEAALAEEWKVTSKPDLRISWCSIPRLSPI